MVLAPGLLSMITPCPRALPRRSPQNRAITSGAAPAGNGTMTLITLLGYLSWARAGLLAPTARLSRARWQSLRERARAMCWASQGLDRGAVAWRVMLSPGCCGVQP